MISWITGNIATILICLALAAILAAVTASIAIDKKKGRSTCGCNCAHCAMAGSCHKAEQK